MLGIFYLGFLSGKVFPKSRQNDGRNSLFGYHKGSTLDEKGSYSLCEKFLAFPTFSTIFLDSSNECTYIAPLLISGVASGCEGIH